MQRCRELFAAAMRGVDDLVYDPEGDRLLLIGEEVTVELLSSEESGGESEGMWSRVETVPALLRRSGYRLVLYLSIISSVQIKDLNRTRCEPFEA